VNKKKKELWKKEAFNLNSTGIERTSPKPQPTPLGGKRGANAGRAKRQGFLGDQRTEERNSLGDDSPFIKQRESETPYSRRKRKKVVINANADSRRGGAPREKGNQRVVRNRLPPTEETDISSPQRGKIKGMHPAGPGSKRINERNSASESSRKNALPYVL